MRIIKTEEEYMLAMQEQPPMPASVMKTGGYFDLAFECGCGQTLPGCAALRYTQRQLKLRFFLRWSPGMPYPHTWLKAQFLAMRSIAP